MIRVNYGGNFCGHIPERPQLEIPNPFRSGVGGLPRILTLAVERLVEFFNNPKLLPTLNGANLSSRQQRSERREACIRVVTSLLKFCDVASLRIGIPLPNGGGVKDLNVSFIASTAGLTLRRTERAIRDLKRAGILKGFQPRVKNQNGEVRGVAAVRFLSVHFFRALGLSFTLETERKRAQKRKTERQREEERKPARTGAERGRAGLLMGALGNIASGVSTALNGALSGLNEPKKERLTPRQEEARRQKLIRIQIEVMKAHPDWEPDRVKAEAARICQNTS